jgi:hypothetical protein
MRVHGWFAVFIGLALSCRAGEPVPLFNGRDLAGWVQRGGKARYSVENGEIVGHAVPGTPNSFLCTGRAYTNFVLELEFLPHRDLNSGVQVRSEAFDVPRRIVSKDRTNNMAAGRVHGYQVEIDPSQRAWTGGIYDEARRGWLVDLKTNDAARAAFRPDAWNTFRIECMDDRIRTWLNGVPAADLRDGMTRSGFVALQVHGIGKRTNDLSIRWRNLRIEER